VVIIGEAIRQKIKWSELLNSRLTPLPDKWNTIGVTMPPPLSPETERRVSLLFLPESRAEASRLLITECGSNLPFFEKFDQFEMERARFSALKLSRGNIEALKDAIELAKADWRDLLVAAGFGDDVDAHRSWLPESRTFDEVPD
jgi:hypothetical protein